MAYHCVLPAGVMVLKVNDLNLVKCTELMESLCLSAVYINVAKDMKCQVIHQKYSGKSPITLFPFSYGTLQVLQDVLLKRLFHLSQQDLVLVEFVHSFGRGKIHGATVRCSYIRVCYHLMIKLHMNHCHH